ncbi:MAG: hypothetical protein A2Y33_06880 [Spirochaetes bacterium GWF1_51_8]|nr:MAG: hypothetical protein A2Y33_06880 [Spirochaetes bacterium GWF1_51_8]
MIPIAIKFSGLKVTPIERDALREYLITTLFEKGKFRILILDEKKMFHSIFDKQLREIINRAEIVLCSSQTVRWAVKLFTKKKVPITMPVTLMLDLLRASEEMSYTVFLFGGDRQISSLTVNMIRKSFPQVRIVGNYPSNISSAELENVQIAFRKSAPQIFFAGLNGGKKQEIWLTEQSQNLSSSVVVGADDAFRVIAGRKQMPPIWVQQKEWTGLYRLIRNPFNVVRWFRITIIFFVTIYRKLFRKNGL